MTKGPDPQAHARDWLERLLGGFYPQANDLDDFVKVCGNDEGLYHEFKPGADPSSGERGDPAAILRKYVAGFANSDGGVVVFGYYQKKAAFDGFRAPGGKLIDWATRAIGPLAAYLAPPPRIFSVPHPGDGKGVEVLLVAVRRAPALVPIVVDNNKTHFYFRIGDSTVKTPSYNTIGVPEYLIADVLLGRRQRPLLVPSRPTLTIDLTSTRRLGANVAGCEVTVGVALENQSLVYADAVTAGLVTWSLDMDQVPKEPPKPKPREVPFSAALPMPAMDFNPSKRAPTAVPQSLEAYLDVTPPEPNTREQWRNPWQLVHAPNWRAIMNIDLPPFAIIELTFGPLALPLFRCTEESKPPQNESDRHHWALRRGLVRVQAALYVVAKGAAPQWFTVQIVYGEESRPQAAEEMRKPSKRANLELRRCDEERARVAMELEKGDVTLGAQADSEPGASGRCL